jgi:hypothetical protein
MNIQNILEKDSEWTNEKQLSIAEVGRLLEILMEAEDRADTTLVEVEDDSPFWELDVDGSSAVEFMRTHARDPELERDVFTTAEGNTDEWLKFINEVNLDPEQVRERLEKHSNLGRPSKVEEWVDRITDEDNDDTLSDAATNVSPSTVYKIRNELEDIGYLEVEDEEEDEEEEVEEEAEA